MSKTRDEAYQRILSTTKVSEQQKKVLEALAVFGPLDRSEISSVTDIRINAVCGRVKELLLRECIVVHDKHINPYTNMRVERLAIKGGEDVQEQT